MPYESIQLLDFASAEVFFLLQRVLLGRLCSVRGEGEEACLKVRVVDAAKETASPHKEAELGWGSGVMVSVKVKSRWGDGRMKTQ